MRVVFSTPRCLCLRCCLPSRRLSCRLCRGLPLRRSSPPAEIMEPMFEMPVVWPICSSAYHYICIQSRNSQDFRNGRNDAPLVGEGKREAWWDLARAVGWERIYCTVTADCRTCSIWPSHTYTLKDIQRLCSSSPLLFIDLAAFKIWSLPPQSLFILAALAKSTSAQQEFLNF